MGNGKKYDGMDPADGVEMKLRYDLIPPEILEHLARIYTHGAKKYGENQWQEVDPFYNRYYAAAERHIQDDRKGETVDPLSGELHLAHAFWNIGALLWKRIKEQGEGTDETNSQISR